MLANKLVEIEQHKVDFTTSQYVELLRLAKKNYEFARFGSAKPAGKYVYWRHDVDLSPNRALRLAQLEHDEGLQSTYFFNPHSDFYNLLENSQAKIIKDIISLGHDIGLHFDAGFYQIQNEDGLDKLLIKEAKLLYDWFGVKVKVFSFHNPNDFMLRCENESYGGLTNCYSKYFKTSVPYCSDSNGYWRFRRLREILEAATDPCLQVLTHPGLWQDSIMSPRERVFRCVYGRASRTLYEYDKVLLEHGRENLAGPTGNLNFLAEIDRVQFELCDYLWNSRRLQSLFIELYRLYERQIKHLCIALFHMKWQVSQYEVNTFFEDAAISIDLSRLFQLAFGIFPFEVNGSSESAQTDWANIRDQLLYLCAIVSDEKLEAGCIYLCGAIEGLAKWGRAQKSIDYDGVSDLGKIGIATNSTVKSDRERLYKEYDTSWGINHEWHEFQRNVKLEIPK
jgi:hypothetical protein